MLKRTRRALRNYRPLLKSGLFWSAQGFILAVAVADRLLESAGVLTDQDVLYFLPVSLFWVPVMLMTFSYGLVGALVTIPWVVACNLPNWLFWHQSLHGRFEEMGLVLIMASTTFFLGHQVDQKVEAQRRAKAYSGYSVRNQEKVLRNLSLDIHDEPLQTLIAACHRLDVLKNSPLPSVELGEIRNSVEQVARELRDIARNLRPSTLEDLGMVAALRQLLADFALRTGLHQELKVIGEEYRLSSDAEMQVFRIAQEALRNIERHARAQKVTVAVVFTDRGIRLEVADDGVGFDVMQARNDSGAANHFGIMGMVERAEMVHGKVEINSDIGKGTIVTAHIASDGKHSDAEF